MLIGILFLKSDYNMILQVAERRSYGDATFHNNIRDAVMSLFHDAAVQRCPSISSTEDRS